MKTRTKKLILINNIQKTLKYIYLIKFIYIYLKIQIFYFIIEKQKYFLFSKLYY